MLHKFVDLDGIMIFMGSMYGEANGADKASIFTVGVYANKVRVLPMSTTVIRLDEFLKTFREMLYFSFYRHILRILL